MRFFRANRVLHRDISGTTRHLITKPLQENAPG
jgi:hypothetical protein